MANGHGGYRQPSKPAAVSGPGAHSARTDGRPKQVALDNAKYGEAKQFEEIQRGAALSGPTQFNSSSTPSAGGATPPPQMPTPLGAPSTMPGQPVTAGADAGAGPGMGALGLPDNSDEAKDLARRFGPLLPYLIRKADDPTSSQDFRDQVRYLVSRIG